MGESTYFLWAVGHGNSAWIKDSPPLWINLPLFLSKFSTPSGPGFRFLNFMAETGTMWPSFRYRPEGGESLEKLSQTGVGPGGVLDRRLFGAVILLQRENPIHGFSKLPILS
jgi:hypothetical protein